MSRRAVEDRQHDGAQSRQRSFLDLDEVDSGMQPETRSIKQQRPRPQRNRAVKDSTPSDVQLVATILREALGRIEMRLAGLESVLHEVHDRMVCGSVVKEYYTTLEVAKLLKKRPYTVREWCRLGRVQGEKSHSGRGLDEEWRISHGELTRIQNEGLLPIQRFGAVERPRRLK